MGSLQLITTFIEVSFYLFSIKRINLMFEEHFIRNNQGYFPTGFVSLLFKRHITQTGPALHKGGYFFRSMFTTIACRTCTNQNRSDTITFDIIIHPVICRYRKEFYTGVGPYRTIIFSISGTYTLFLYLKMQQNRVLRVSYAKIYFRLVGILSPINTLNGLEINLFFIEQFRKRTSLYVSRTNFLYFHISFVWMIQI